MRTHKREGKRAREFGEKGGGRCRKSSLLPLLATIVISAAAVGRTRGRASAAVELPLCASAACVAAEIVVAIATAES